jgi:hypothetical protein
MLRKRLYDQLVVDLRTDAVHVDTCSLLSICKSSHQITVQTEERGDWSALLTDQNADFVDVYNPHDDMYPEEMWEEFGSFCEGAGSDSISLPGGRFACAEELRKCGLSSFTNRSLGELCHIVELGVKKRIIGYDKNGHVVPFRHSLLMEKERLADQQVGIPGVAEGTNSQVRVVGLEEARECLKQLLREQTAGFLPLPNVKRLFLSRFHVTLSETAFGHSRVSDLLQDEQFNDAFTVEWRGSGYVVSEKRHVINLSNIIAPSSEADSIVAESRGTSEDIPYWVDTERFDTDAHSGRLSKFCEKEPLHGDAEFTFPEGEPVMIVPSPGPTATMDSTVDLGTSGPHWSFSPGTVLKMVRGPFIHAVLPPPTPVQRSKRRIQTVPMNMGRASDECLGEFDDASDGSTAEGTESNQLSRDTSSTSASSRGLQAHTDGADCAISDTETAEQKLLSSSCADRSGSSGPTSSGNLSKTAESKKTRRVGWGDDLFVEDHDPNIQSLIASSVAERVNESMTPITPFNTGERKKNRRVGWGDQLLVEEMNFFVESQPATPGARDIQKRSILTPRALGKEGVMVQNTFLNVRPALPTPVRSYCSKSADALPSWSSLTPSSDPPSSRAAFGDTITPTDAYKSLLISSPGGSMTPITPFSRREKESTRRVGWGEQLIVEEQELEVANPERRISLTPGALKRNGFTVQNTFINVPPSLPTPSTSNSSRRSNSAPRVLSGSAKLVDSWVQSPANLQLPSTPWLFPGLPSPAPREMSSAQALATYDFPATPW